VEQPIHRVSSSYGQPTGHNLDPPVTKRLACGDYGNGAMAETSQIYTSVRLTWKAQPHDASSSLVIPLSNNHPSS